MHMILNLLTTANSVLHQSMTVVFHLSELDKINLHDTVMVLRVVSIVEFPISFPAYTENIFPVSVHRGLCSVRTSVMSQS